MKAHPILVADDDMTTQLLLQNALEEWGYSVIVRDNGIEALEIINSGAVSVALLDWDMPGYDGITVCRRLMKQKCESSVYRILLTAKEGSENISRGLEAGAHDYIIKPFDPIILQSRIRAGLRFYKLEKSLFDRNRALRKYAFEMERLAQERAEQLIHADRLTTIGMLTAGVAHEVNNPSTFISGNISILKELWPLIRRGLHGLREEVSPEDASRLDFAIEEIPPILSAMESGVNRIGKIVEGLKLYARKDSIEQTEFSLAALIHDSLALLQASLKNIALDLEVDDSLMVYGDYQKVEQVLVNLLVNAVDELHSLEGREQRIRIATEEDDKDVWVHVHDTGPGIAESVREKLFSPFFTTKEPGKGTGLGLSICAGIIEQHGGTIRASSSELGGALFSFSIPKHST